MNFEELSDRELDALCAERVMGYERVLDPPAENGYSRMRFFDREGQEIERGFAPSLLIRHAFEVVEAMRERGYEVDFESYSADVGFPKGFWQARLYNSEWHVIGSSENHESLPRAIVIAALRAVDA